MEKRIVLDGSRTYQEFKKGSLAFKALPLLLASVGIGSIPFLPKCGGAPSLAHEGNEAPSRTVAHNHPDGPEIDDDGTGEDEFVFDDQTVQKQREFLKETIACIENGFEPDDETDFVDCELVQQDKFSEIACTTYDADDYPVTTTHLYGGPVIYDDFDFANLDFENGSNWDDLDQNSNQELKYALLSSEIGFSRDNDSGLVFQTSQPVSNPLFYRDSLDEVTGENALNSLCERGLNDLAFDPSYDNATLVRDAAYSIQSGDTLLADVGIVRVGRDDSVHSDSMMLSYLVHKANVSDGVTDLGWGSLYEDKFSGKNVYCFLSVTEKGDPSSECTFAGNIGKERFKQNPNPQYFDVFSDSSDFIDRLARGEN